MPQHLCLSITFLDCRFHGRCDGGEPEWPPSPLRLYQAIVAASAAATGRLDAVADALLWLEGLGPPMIVAPQAEAAAPYRLSVPNNAMDLVAAAWARGNYEGSGDANPATHRTMKVVRPMRMLNGDQVHYLWDMPDKVDSHSHAHASTVAGAVRSVVAFGWGVDLAVGHGRLISAVEAAELQGERWAPAARAGTGGTLRTPRPGTLAALVERHDAFTGRLSTGSLVPVPPLTAFEAISYRRDTDLPPRSVAAFCLLRIDGEGLQAFSTARRTLTVAGMVRHALAGVARDAGWTTERINEVIHGHTPDGASPGTSDPGKMRFSYVPLPSIQSRGNGRSEHVGDIRRVLITGNASPDAEALARWVHRSLAGRDLIDEADSRRCAMLAPIPTNDAMVRRYTGSARVWATVTPIVLDRHPKQRRREAAIEETCGIIVGACERAGFPRPSAVNLSPVAPYPGVTHAHLFAPLRRKDGSAPNQTHAVIAFDAAVSGPVLIGAGRFRGYGLCAPYDRGS